MSVGEGEGGEQEMWPHGSFFILVHFSFDF